MATCYNNLPDARYLTTEWRVTENLEYGDVPEGVEGYYPFITHFDGPDWKLLVKISDAAPAAYRYHLRCFYKNEWVCAFMHDDSYPNYMHWVLGLLGEAVLRK
jgi:hypothetical protein